MIIVCPICNTSKNGIRAAAKHISAAHKLSAKEILFVHRPDIFNDCSVCNRKIKYYITDTQSRKVCGTQCERVHRSRIKQTLETIQTRIKNTDQVLKEQKRQATMLQRYGQLTFIPDPQERSKKISNSLKGTKHTEEHHKKVIASKIKNGTIKHTAETKLKISKSINKINQGSDPPIYISNNTGGGNYERGYINNLFYRSSYEKQFIKYCIQHNIKIESAETKEFRVQYIFNNKKHYYYPDFFLPEYDCIVEIKPYSRLCEENVIAKIHAACNKHNNFTIITEEELDDLDSVFVNMSTIT